MHVCTGGSAALARPDIGEYAQAQAEASPVGFSPVYYFRQALAIVRFDSAAIVRAANDRNAFWHGVLFFMVGGVLGLLVDEVIANRGRIPDLVEIPWLDIFLTAMFAMGLVLTYYAVFQWVVRRLFGAKGTYRKLVPPTFLSTILTWLAPIPIVNLLVGVWEFMVFVAICEEIEDVERWEVVAGAVIAAIPFFGAFLWVTSWFPT